MIVTNGIISFKIDGYFKKEKYKKLKIFFLSSLNTLESSKKLIKIINNEIIIKFINKYLFVKKKR